MSSDHESAMFASGEAYEDYVGRWSRPVAHGFLDWLNLSTGLRWVDVGCGTGALSQVVNKTQAPSRVVGVEPSEGFIGVALANSDAAIEFMQGNAMALPLESHDFDVVVSALMLNFVPDPAVALAEMVRVLRPGGTVGAYVWDYAGEMQLMRYFWDAVAELFDGGEAYDEGNLFPICDPVALDELFNAAGLEAVETCALDVPTMFRDFEDYWSPFLAGQGPAGVYCAALSDADRERLRRHLLAALPRNADASIELVARAWAVRGTVIEND